MRFPLALPLIVLAAFSACKKSEPGNLTPTKGVAAGFDMIDYDAPKGSFTVRAPSEWGIRETERDGDNVTFVSRPLAACGGRLASINFVRYPDGPGDPKTDARKFAETFWEITPGNKQPEIAQKKMGDHEALLLHYERPFRKVHSKKVQYMTREDHALIPLKGGFMQIWHSAPSDCYQATLPVFEAVVRGFKPKP